MRISDFGYVYVLKAQDGRYKIGMTKNFERRLKRLEYEFGKLTVYAVFQSYGYDWAEKSIHRTFARQREEREWFSLDEKDLVRLDSRIEDFKVLTESLRKVLGA